MEQKQNSTCPVCGSSSYSPFMLITDWFLTQKKFKTNRCNNCTLIYNASIPDNLASYYKSDEYISHSETKSALSSIYKTVQKLTLNQKLRLIHKHTKGKKILDYGSGKGDFMNHMLQNGFDISGFEPDSDARSIAKDKHGIDLLDNLNGTEKESLDIITMWHVLEHIPNPNEIIAKLVSKLKSGGLYVIAVPNHESYDADYYKEYWAAYDVPRHLLHFNPKSMNHLASNNGLELIETVPMLFDSTYVSLLSEKYKRKAQNNSYSISSQLKAVCIGLLSNIYLLKNKKRCSSLIYVLKKQ